MIRKLTVPTSILAASAAIAGVAFAASSPAVTTGDTSNVGQTSAVLKGTINPEGSSTTYYFQWGLTTGYGVNGSTHSAGSGTRALTVAETATELDPGTTYHYRLVATNQSGTSVGADRTFKTAGHPPPGVTTGPATQVSATGSTLTGIINPAGAPTTFYFQWGTTTNYGQQTAAQALAAVFTPQSINASLQGILAPRTIYHYRLVASHTGSATSYGADGTFMTPASPLPVPAIGAHTTPRHARQRPFVLTTSGSIGLPSWLPQQYACNGNVTIRFFRGLKQVAFTLAGIQSNCTFTAQTAFAGLPGRRSHRPVRLRVVIRSIANTYLATNRAAIEHVTLG
jgi:hypothetical protein